MAQSSEQALFSSGNTTATRERQITAANLTRHANATTDIVRLDLSGAAVVTKTFTQLDLGKVVICDMGTSAAVHLLTLPAATSSCGQTLRICCVGNGTGSSTITSPSLFAGSFVAEFNDTVVVAAVSHNTLTFDTGADVGTDISFFSDGAKWFVSGIVASGALPTFSAV